MVNGLPWLSNHCPVPVRTVQLYMRLARHAPELEAKCATVAYLTVREAAYLVTAPIGRADVHASFVINQMEPREIRALGFEITTEHKEMRGVGYVTDEVAEKQADRDRQVWLITRYIRDLASNTSEFADVGDLAFIVERVPRDQQAEMTEQLIDIQRFASLLGEALKQAARLFPAN
jgi:hypothetical protein